MVSMPERENPMTGSEHLEQIVRGLEGVTEGPWAVDGYSTDAVIYMPAGESHVSQWKHLLKCGTADGHWRHNAAHFARCHPATIREISAYVRDLEVKLAKATEALEPFSALASEFTANGDLATKADDRTVWGFNDQDLSYGDFRRARAAYSNLRTSP